MKEDAVNLVVEGLKKAGVEKVTQEVKSLRTVERNVTWGGEK